MTQTAPRPFRNEQPRPCSFPAGIRVPPAFRGWLNRWAANAEDVAAAESQPRCQHRIRFGQLPGVLEYCPEQSSAHFGMTRALLFSVRVPHTLPLASSITCHCRGNPAAPYGVVRAPCQIPDSAMPTRWERFGPQQFARARRREEERSGREWRNAFRMGLNSVIKCRLTFGQYTAAMDMVTEAELSKSEYEVGLWASRSFRCSSQTRKAGTASEAKWHRLLRSYSFWLRTKSFLPTARIGAHAMPSLGRSFHPGNSRQRHRCRSMHSLPG